MDRQQWQTILNDNQYLDDEEYGNHLAPLRDGIVFLIDIHPHMLLKNENDESPLIKSLQALRDWMLRDVIANDKNMVGIVFFGTEMTKNLHDFKHIYIYQEFNQLGADRIKEIELLIKSLNNGETKFVFGDIKKTYTTSIAETLWICSNQYLNCKYKMGTKKIYMITCQDDPHFNDAHLKKQAIQRGHDVNELDIDMGIIGFPDPSMPKHFFDLNLFYKELLSLTEDEVEMYPTADQEFDELSSRLRVKDFQKKAISKLHFNFGHGVTLGVSLYTLVSATKIQPAVKLDKDTLEEINKKVKEEGVLETPANVPEEAEKEIGSTADEADENVPNLPLPQKYMVFGGAKIYFDVGEIKTMKNFGEPGLTLIGFKPATFLKPYWFIRPCQFIYPDETSIIGSTKLLRALLLRCHYRRVVPICSFISRHYGNPSIVALIPQLEELNEDGIQIQPPGFHVLYLPYSEDYRKVPWPQPARPDVGKKDKETALDRAKDMVQRLKFSYSITNFDNPVLQKHYRVLEALALDRPMSEVESFHDSTLPDAKLIDERLKKQVKAFKNAAFPENYEPPEPGAKKPAKITLSKRIDAAHIKKCVEMEELDRMTLPILKEFCKILNIKKSSGTKDSFIKTLKAYYTQQSKT